MNRVSKLLALLLAFVLSMGVFTGAVAEGNGVIEYPIYVDMTLDAAIANFTNLTPEKQYAVLVALGDDTAKQDELAAQLTEEQLTALREFIYDVESSKVSVAVNFIDAGPFMPPVKVQTTRQVMKYAARGAAAGTTEPVEADGVITTKEVIPNGTNAYTLRLSTFVEGNRKVTVQTKSVPVDIVLVLDQSGSMKDGFTGSSSRQAALKTAVSSFISSVAGKYSADSDHRMAIVTFAGGASVLQGWTAVDENGKTTLTNKVNGLTNPTGATNIAAGMEEAEKLMDEGENGAYQYTGKNTTRQKVVIAFTDGMPTTSSDYSTGVADKAIASAKKMKDTGVTVYSIGIFSNANPDQMYGSASGEVGQSWKGRRILIFGDVSSTAVPACNRFLNYLSSNSSDATSVGLRREGFDLILYAEEEFTITENFTLSKTGYYLTAGNSEKLTGVFEDISDEIESGSVSYELDAKTVVKDIVAESFTLPAGTTASGITVYTQDYNGTSLEGKTTPDELDVCFSGRTDLNSADMVTVSGSNVSVTGFNYKENWVGPDEDSSGNVTPHGKRLVIEIPIEVREGFLGGNNVLTNGPGSGVYPDASTDEPIEEFVSPKVNVEVAVVVNVDAQDKHVYLYHDLTAEEMLEGVKVTCDPVVGEPFELNMDPNVENFGLADWQHAYVTIDQPKGTELTDITVDGSYTVTCTITPDDTSGSASAKSDSDTANIYVYKPVLTFQDSQIDYASIAAADYYNKTNNRGVVWQHVSVVEDTTEVTVADEKTMGAPPALGLSYTPALNTWQDEQSKVIGVEDVPVTVAVTLGSTDVTSHVTFVRNECKYSGCDWTPNYEPNKPAFVVHITNVFGSLTIEKEGLNQYTYTDGSDYESAIVTVSGNGKTWTVVLCEDNDYTVKLINLLVGEYTVTEQNGWTWRYKNDASVATAIVNGGQNTPVTFTNVHNNQQWLGGDNFEVNNFSTTAN